MENSLSKQKKILFISYMYLDYHMCKVSRFNILDQLNELGYKTYLYAACINKNDVQKGSGQFKLYFSSVPGLQILNFVIYQFKSIFKIPYIIYNQKIDIVMCDINSTPSLLPLLILKKLRLIKTIFILDFRSNILHSRKNKLQTILKNNYLKLVIKISHYLYDGFTFITESIKQYIERNYSLNFNSYTIWSSAVSEDFLKEAKKVDDSKFVILHHGSLEKGRGIMRLINAMPLMSLDDSYNIELAIAGNGSLVEKIKDISMDNSSNIKFYGQLDKFEIINLIDSANLCVIPFDDSIANNTSSPLKLMEYIARNKIILATQLRNFKDNFQNYSSLYFLNSNNSNDIALSLSEFIREYIFYIENHKYDGIDLIKRRYTWKIQAKKIDKYLQKLI